MNILYTLNSGNFGGMERHVTDLAVGMRKKGHNIYVWCKNGPIIDLLQSKDIKITTIDIKSAFDPNYIVKLINFLKKNNIQILHAHELKAVVNSIFAAYLAGTKVRLSHTHTPISEWKINPIKKFINIAVNSIAVNLFSTKEIALTNSRKNVKQKEGISSKKLLVTTVSNGIDIDLIQKDLINKDNLKQAICKKYNINSTNTIWGYVARLSQEKGHLILLKAFENFLNDNEDKNHTLILVGGGRLKKEINNYIKSHQLENNVIVTGVYPNEEALGFYMSFNYFIHPSLSEGFGISLLEAMASRLPIIASDLEVFHEIAKDTIVYFKTGDSTNLVTKMKDIVSDITVSQIEEAYKIAHLYSIDKFVEEYEQIYQKFLNLELV